jgi:hypothetical protein
MGVGVGEGLETVRVMWRDVGSEDGSGIACWLYGREGARLRLAMTFRPDRAGRTLLKLSLLFLLFSYDSSSLW